MPVRSRLKEYMEERDLTQQEVAGATRLSPTIVNRLYHNRFSRLDNGTVETVCTFFDVELGEMFYIERDKDDKGVKIEPSIQHGGDRKSGISKKASDVATAPQKGGGKESSESSDRTQDFQSETEKIVFSSEEFEASAQTQPKEDEESPALPPDVDPQAESGVDVG